MKNKLFLRGNFKKLRELAEISFFEYLFSRKKEHFSAFMTILNAVFMREFIHYQIINVLKLIVLY
jgi:hypothetical protein